MSPFQLEAIAEAYADDRLREADDDFLDGILKRQDIDDICDIDEAALSDKQQAWLRDILDRAQA
jgi:hypothetical protein